MNRHLLQLRQSLGATGVLALALMALAAAFAFLAVKPLEKRNTLLVARIAQASPAQQPDSAAQKVASVYGFLATPEQTTDWLAKLHGIGSATGVQLRSASYKTQPAEGRLVRYEIVLPVAGSYPQIRDFLKRSLAEIPVLSVDQLTLKRENQGAVHAELRLTLHMVKS
jgi:Tfp pilus assembly protein PilO